MSEGFYVDPVNYQRPPAAESARVAVSPRMRVWRTAIQALLAVLAAIPAAVALLPADRIGDGTVAWLLAGPPALTVIISAGWNTIDARRESGETKP